MTESIKALTDNPSEKERERKFLIKKLPDNMEQYPHKKIDQGYLAITQDGTEIRLRKKGNKYFQTVKSEGGEERDEKEIELTEEQFNSLWPITAGKRIVKTRYEIPDGNGVLELDVYQGDLKGLIVVEREFKDEKESKEFVPLDWFGDEVTEDKAYKNKNLAVHGMPKEEQVEEVRKRVVGL
jgi:CYTH domain-containing protein